MRVNNVGDKGTTASYKAELQVNGQIVTMEIDTGAAVSLISQKTYSNLFQIMWSTICVSTGFHTSAEFTQPLPLLSAFKTP